MRLQEPRPRGLGGRTAGLLVDEAGGKGRRIGGAVISERHGNFLVNTGEASAQDVFTLIEETQARVVEHSGVELELEVKLWRRP